jgi:truncated hemoglobin YjbI
MKTFFGSFGRKAKFLHWFSQARVIEGRDPESLLEKIGGPAGFDRISFELNEKITKMPELRAVYRGMDKEQLNEIKEALLQFIFRTIPATHPKNQETIRIFSTLGLKHKELELQTNILVEILRSLQISELVIDQALLNFMRLKKKARLESKTLFEKIGREDGIRMIVDIFYRKVLKDEELKIFFEHVNTDQLM